jgi:hypothetical protein
VVLERRSVEQGFVREKAVKFTPGFGMRCFNHDCTNGAQAVATQGCGYEKMLNSSARRRMKNTGGNKSPRRGVRNSISRMTRMAVIMWQGCCGFEAEADAAIWN